MKKFKDLDLIGFVNFAFLIKSRFEEFFVEYHNEHLSSHEISIGQSMKPENGEITFEIFNPIRPESGFAELEKLLKEPSTVDVEFSVTGFGSIAGFEIPIELFDNAFFIQAIKSLLGELPKVTFGTPKEASVDSWSEIKLWFMNHKAVKDLGILAGKPLELVD
jgi:hypothetical protein